METLVDKVERRRAELDSREGNSQSVSTGVSEAMKLFEQFCDVKPQEYILPLDALAGFCSEARQSRRLK